MGNEHCYRVPDPTAEKDDATTGQCFAVFPNVALECCK